MSAATEERARVLDLERRCIDAAIRAPERLQPTMPPLDVNPIGPSVDVRDVDPVLRTRRWQVTAYYVPKLAPEGSRSDNRALQEVVVGDKALDARYGVLERDPLYARVVVAALA